MINCIYPFTSTFLDFPDNESLALSIYFLGCDNGCSDCSNPDFANRNYSKGSSFSINELYSLIKKDASRFNTNKLVFLGGDPLFKDNISNTKELSKLLYEDYDICIYTGHNIDYIKNNNIDKFTYIKCEKYILYNRQESKKTDAYLQFASTNQKLYNNKYELLSDNGRFYFNEVQK